jgi:hypothetical protein
MEWVVWPRVLDGSFRAGAKEVDTTTDAGGLRTKEGLEHDLLSKADCDEPAT